MILTDAPLEVCPFCGSDGVLFTDYRYKNHINEMWLVYGVTCSNENCIMHQTEKFYMTEVDARRAWNVRTANKKEDI